MADEPGPEEGGEDVFAMPPHCTICDDDRPLKPIDGFIKCQACGASYGPVEDNIDALIEEYRRAVFYYAQTHQIDDEITMGKARDTLDAALREERDTLTAKNERIGSQNSTFCDRNDYLADKVQELTAERDALLKEVEHLKQRLSANHHSWKSENDALRALIACTECSEELGTGNYHGWMAGICPGCQGAYYPPEDQ